MTRHPALAYQARVVRALSLNTVRESLRGRLLITWLALIALGIGTQFFLHALAIVEHATITLSVAAPLMRVAAVLITAAFVIAAVGREIGERDIEMTFAAPIPRPVWVLGRLLGFAAVAIGTALNAALPLLFEARAGALFAWTTSLAAELVMVVGLALWISISIVRIPLALLSFVALYACARLIGVIQMIQHAEQAAQFSPADWLIDTLATLLPRMDLATRTDWLLPGQPMVDSLAVLGPVFSQTAIFTALAITAAAIDIDRRRN